MRTRITIRLALLAMAFAAVASTCRGQLSLNPAVDLALKNDPRVKIAAADVAHAQAALSEARDAFVPTVGAEGGYGKSTGAPLGLPTVFSLSLQSLVFNFSQRDNIRSAASGLESAQLALKDAREQVTEDVVTTYLSLDAALQRRDAMRQEYGYANKLVQITKDRVEAGQDPSMDTLRAQRTAAQIHLAELQEEDQIASLQDHLARAVGLKGVALVTVSASIPPMPPLPDATQQTPMSPGIAAAFASAKSKRELAFGLNRYLYRPQAILEGNYSRLNTSPSQSNFLDYYPNFKGKSNNDAAIAIQITIPLYDRAHAAREREAAAEASHSLFTAQQQYGQFLEGRAKLRRSADELQARADLAEIDRQIAQADLNNVLTQLNAAGSAGAGQPMTPKDEQNARIQERQKYVDLLNAENDLHQAQVNLMRQTGTLDDWLEQAILSSPQH